ncbi:unnamed protein product [Rhizoctonia solani]|uniref:Uncharacterized protein n=1 Tax=Rhizoctonia solani TaxID=456999 RepID=A0A8H2WYS7_9AGAM|nr:unnamed protein product [Rhizoctonia solani]
MDNAKSLGESITWIIDAQSDGTLWDQVTGREVTYLFWEARDNAKLLISPPVTRPSSPIEAPSSALDTESSTVLPSQSALLPFDKVTGYIDDVLLALGLHTEARTSFITYWLPNMSKHAFIALRFLPQGEWEKAVPLNITPAPDVTTRVFMLFMGIEQSQLSLWDEAVTMARRDVTVWRDIVGVDISKETIASIKKNVHRLRKAPSHQIVISALLEEVNDHVQITEEVWPNLLSSLMTIRVELDEEMDASSVSSNGLTSEIEQCPAPSPPLGWEDVIPRNGIYRAPANMLTSQSTDGTLWDQGTEREVTYLFWEALTNPKLPLSPFITRPSSPVEAPFCTFDPSSPILLPSHSALLPFDKVTGYIDDVLLALGLHTEARTSFITYWLPNLSKHTFIALRFLPQGEYETAAPLTITPAPELTTRVFMLFMGIEQSQIALWDEAVVMASRDVTVWRDIVGVDISKVHDKSLFRVLEWGGMEVK